MSENISNFFSALGELGSNVITNLLNFLWDFLEFLIHLLFDWINIPAFPEDLNNSVNEFLNLIFNNLGFLGFFIRPQTLKIVIPLLIFLFNFKYIYKLVMWIIRKLPFLSIK